MGIIADVKCARCDRKYSGLRSRCPYCGARRIGRGKYSEQSDDNKGKMLIGILIMAVLVVAVVVLLLTTNTPEDDISPDGPVIETPGTNTDIPGEGDNTSATNDNSNTPPSSPDPVDTSTEPPSPLPPAISSVMITYVGAKRTEFTCKVNERVPLRIKVEPPGTEVEIIWESSNNDVFDIIDMNETGENATVIGLSPGNGTLTIKVGDITETCIVRVTR